MRPGAQTSLRALGGDNVLYMNAFTKKLLPSLRLGYVVGNAQTLPSLLQAKKLSINGTPALVEEALFHFLARGHFDTYLATLEAECEARYRHCVELLGALLPDDVRWTRPAGGPVLWLELPRRIAIDTLIGELAARKVLVNPQDTAFIGPAHLHGVMIGFGFPDRAEMTTAIEILAGLLH
jgi:2-aminoadipate transaminase